MKRTAVMSLVFAAMFLFNGCANAEYYKRSDYDQKTFDHLLTGQVWVFKQKSSRGPSRDENISAYYFSPDGYDLGCWFNHKKATHVEDPGYWMLRADADYLTLLGLGLNKVFDTTTKKNWYPIFYDPESGKFHNKTWWRGKWHMGRDGWIQSSWPRSLKDACPDIKLPEHLKINEKQTSLIMDEVRAQDPAAPIKNFGGHTPAPVTTPPVSGTSHDQLISILGPNQTNIWKSEDGGLFAVNLKDHREGQLWSIGKDDEVYDVGNFRYTDGQRGLEITWQGSRETMSYRFGDEFPLVPTNRPYPAFVFADWMVNHPDEVVLTFNGQKVAFLFLDEGKLIAEENNNGKPGRAIGGTWWLENGRLFLSLPGFEISHMTWQEAAKEANWKQSTELSSQ